MNLFITLGYIKKETAQHKNKKKVEYGHGYHQMLIFHCYQNTNKCLQFFQLGEACEHAAVDSSNFVVAQIPGGKKTR